MSTEPFTVERLREMMEAATPSVRECSTVLWAADEIDRLRARAENAEADADRLAEALTIVDLDLPKVADTDGALRAHAKAVAQR